jgi:hypothetical protein
MAEALVGMNHVLNVIGFAGADDRNNIMDGGLAQFEDFRYLVERDIRDMADDFGKRTQANGRIVFGLGRTKKLVGVMHWVHDCYRASDVPNHEHFDEETLFEALSMAQIRKLDMELVATNSKAADPGKFNDERKWPEWEKAFTNYLSVIPGVSGIPLSYYVVREQDEPTPGMDYSTFNERMMHRAPLTGQYYIADARRVHNLLVGFLQGENTENWIRNIARYQDGRRDMTALRRHYAGEGNSTTYCGCQADSKFAPLQDGESVAL